MNPPPMWTPTGTTAGVQNTLTFTSTDWSTAQTVTVNAGEDDDAVNDAAAIAHAVVDASSAAEYDPLANVDLAVTVTDDDSAGITVTAADPFTVGEGASATYTVQLNTEPSARRGHPPHGLGQQRGDGGRHRRGDGRGAEHPDLHVRATGARPRR